MKTRIINLGIIGMSEGNGHPYSWSAIFNGFNKEEMAKCAFPVIPEYLNRQSFPQSFLTDVGRVTHIWTQNTEISESIAKASNIANIVKAPEDLIGVVDAILLARDDAENHVKFALPFIKAGLPIFIDKPLALNVKDAREMLDAQVYEDQIFTCSSFRYDKNFSLSADDLDDIGTVRHVEGSIMKSWQTYGIHILEAMVTQLPGRGGLQSVKSINNNGITQVIIAWKNLTAYIKVTGEMKVPLEVHFYGDSHKVTKTFSDSFASFRDSLAYFIEVIGKTKPNIPREETLEMVQIIEEALI